MSFRIGTRHLAYAACAFFALAILSMLFIMPRNALKARGAAKLPMRSLGNRPVLQIELARSEADLAQIFLPGNTEANLSDASVGNNLDTFLFIPAYTGFLISLGLLLARNPRIRIHRALLLITLLVPIIAVFDWAENWGIERTIHHIETQGSPQSGDASSISTPSLAKWILTMLILAVFGVEAFYTASWRWFPVGTVLLLLSLWIAIILSAYARERWA